MSGFRKQLNMAGQSFFGKMSASTTHELKNALAIINENAGLLNDLSQMVESGAELSAERLKSITGRIRKQVVRADDVTTKLNQFAHSMEHPIEPLELAGLVHTVLDLGRRIIEQRRMEFEIETPQAPVTVSSNRFYLMNLIWSCIEIAMDSVDSDACITIDIRATSAGGSVSFNRIDQGPEPLKIRELTDMEKALLQGMGAELIAAETTGGFVLKLPASCRYQFFK
ncbi:MAG: hypothetical protein HKM93_12430 [Desulfobacteraceae bacterium]|nr:hypothetical protein [Desulfobacteraceae bacterium]